MIVQEKVIFLLVVGIVKITFVPKDAERRVAIHAQDIQKEKMKMETTNILPIILLMIYTILAPIVIGGFWIAMLYKVIDMMGKGNYSEQEVEKKSK